MLAGGHFASTELRDRAFDLRKLHNSFVSRLDARRNTLSAAVNFYLTAQEVGILHHHSIISQIASFSY